MAKYYPWLLSLFLFCFYYNKSSAQEVVVNKIDCLDSKWQERAEQGLFHARYATGYMSEQWQKHCDSLLNICPNFDYIWEMKAMPHIKGGIYDFASLNKAVSINPVRQLPYRAFMKCIFAKDYYGALLDLDSAEQLVHGGGIMDHSFSFYKGLCYLSIGKADSAVIYLQKDVSTQSKKMGVGNEHYNSLFYLGLAHLQAKQIQQAETYLIASIKAYSKFPEPNYYLGLLYLQKNEKIKAKTYFELAQSAIANGYNMNEDNNIYVDYPFQISAVEIEQSLKE